MGKGSRKAPHFYLNSFLTLLLGAVGYGNQPVVLADNVTGSGTIDFLVGDSVNNRQNRNPIQLYSIWIWGTNVERMLLVAIVNRYAWEKDVKELWNTIAGLNNNCTLSVAAKSGTSSDGFTISYSITNGSSCRILAKRLNY